MNAPTPPGSLEQKIYSGTALRVLNLLASGLTQSEAAKACGISESYISQLKEDPSFMGQLNAKVQALMAQQSKIDENLNTLEEKLSERLVKLADSMYNPDVVLRTLKFANEARRKMPQVSAGQGNNGTGAGTGSHYTTLILPVVVAKEYVMNPMKEVVAIGDKELVTMDAKTMDQFAQKQRTNTEMPAALQDKLPEVKNGSPRTRSDRFSNL